MTENGRHHRQPTFADLAPYALDRFDGIQRDYGMDEVLALRGSVLVQHTLAELGAKEKSDRGGGFRSLFKK